MAAKPLVSDGAGKAPIAYAQKTLVPVFFRQPDFEMDFRICTRTQDSLDPAERRQVMQGLVDTGSTQVTRGYWFGKCDGGVRQAELLECIAVGGVEGGCGEKSQQPGADQVYWLHRSDCSSAGRESEIRA